MVKDPSDELSDLIRKYCHKQSQKPSISKLVGINAQRCHIRKVKENNESRMNGRYAQRSLDRFFQSNYQMYTRIV